MVDERRNRKQDNRSDRDRASDSRDFDDVDPLTDYVSYILSQAKAPLRVRVFIRLYGIYWRVKSCLGRII